MKRYFALITVMLMALTTFTFSSCEVDPDTEIATTLWGTWSGSISSVYRDRWGLQGNSYRTTIQFNTDGTGYEVDYDVRNPYRNYAYTPFDWYVSHGQIEIDYDDAEWTTAYIYDYELTDYSFSGMFDDGTNRDIYFNLALQQSFDWDPYWDYVGYAKPTIGMMRTDSMGGHASKSGEFARTMKK